MPPWPGPAAWCTSASQFGSPAPAETPAPTKTAQLSPVRIPLISSSTRTMDRSPTTSDEKTADDEPLVPPEAAVTRGSLPSRPWNEGNRSLRTQSGQSWDQSPRLVAIRARRCSSRAVSAGTSWLTLTVTTTRPSDLSFGSEKTFAPANPRRDQRVDQPLAFQQSRRRRRHRKGRAHEWSVSSSGATVASSGSRSTPNGIRPQRAALRLRVTVPLFYYFGHVKGTSLDMSRRMAC